MTHTPTPEEYNTGNSTPLPWEVEPGFYEVCNNGTRIPTWNVIAPRGWLETNGTFSKCSIMSALESEGDARLIVTAVNSHAQLVEACKWIVDSVESGFGNEFEMAVDKCKKALSFVAGRTI